MLLPTKINGFFTALLFALFLSTGARAEDVKVVTDIKPIHSLAAALMRGAGEPVYLVPDGASPHDYALRPSDLRALEGAKVIAWMGPHMSPFLTKVLKGRGALDLSRIEGLAQLNLRRPGIAPLQTADRLDPHLWQDPALARIIARQLAEALTKADPGAPIYAKNLKVLEAELDRLEDDLDARLSGVGGYLVIAHDSLQYLTQRYDIPVEAILTEEPEQPMSLSRVAAVRRRLTERPNGCVADEPGFPEDFTAPLIAGTSARAVRLDPLGGNIPAGPGHYAATLRKLADDLAECLNGQRRQ